MGKFDGILIMSDFDGTLSAGKGIISEENREAIKYFENEGGIFSIASGRLGRFVASLNEQVPLNGYSVVINGTILCDASGEKCLFEHPVDREKMMAFTKMLCESLPNRLHVRFVTKDEVHMIYPNEDLDSAVAAIQEPIYKFLYVVPAEYSDEYLARIRKLAGDDFYVSRSWINGIEIQPANTSKGDAVSTLKKLYGGKVHTVIAVGDFENDIDMIKKADIGYAVANATDEVKAAADRVTVACNEHAIAKIISEL